MNVDFLKLFKTQRQIFGICPCCGEFFRLSECHIYSKMKPEGDWMDALESSCVALDQTEERIDKRAEKLDEQEEQLREEAREKGRRRAMRAIRKVDPIFTQKRLNPDDARVIFHPVEYIVFNGMKGSSRMKNIILIDRQKKSVEHRRSQRSIERAVERGNYDWLTLRVREDGSITEE